MYQLLVAWVTTFLLFCSSPEKLPPWIRIRRANVETHSPGGHSLQHGHQKAHKLQGLGSWTQSLVRRERKGKEQGTGLRGLLRGDLLQVYQTARTRTRRMGRKPMPHTCQFIQRHWLIYVRIVWGGYSFSSGDLGNQYGFGGRRGHGYTQARLHF